MSVVSYPMQKQSPPQIAEATSATPRHYIADAIGEVDGNAATGSTATVAGNTFYVKGGSGWTQIAGGGGGITEVQAMMGTSFFDTNAILPVTTLHATTTNFPTVDFSNLNSGTVSDSMSRRKFTSSADPANWGWDTGALRTKILAMAWFRMRNNAVGIAFSDAAVATSEFPNGTYLAQLEPVLNRAAIYKRTGGAYTALATETSVDFADSPEAATIGTAFYYDDSSGRLALFLKYGSEQWFPVIDTTDSSFTTMRYVGTRVSRGTIGHVFYEIAPHGIWYTT